MDRRAAAVAAANVSAESASAGLTIETLANATRVPAAKLLFIEGAPELTFGDLQDVGGVLSVSPAVFLEGVPSA